MARIFISYRREDGIARPGRINDRLVSRYGEDQVFMDLGKIATGADFESVLGRELASCEVFIAIIGERWLVSRKGRRRLEDPSDFVRREIASALARNVHILPVLVGDAKMPEPQDLPAELAPFARRNATRISDERFDAAMDGLILDIEDPDRPPEDTALNRWAQLRQQIHLRRRAAITGAFIVLFSTLITWTSVFDLFTLDTRLQSLSLGLGHLLSRPLADERVVIVSIDEQTEQALKRKFDSSWRREHGILLDHLSLAGARAIAFDMYFEQPSAADDGFIDAIDRARARGTEVFVGMRTLSKGLPNVLPALRDHVSGVGLLCVGGRLGYAKRVGLGVLAAFGPTPSISLNQTKTALLVPDAERVREIALGLLEDVKSVQNNCPALRLHDEAAQLIISLSDLKHWREGPWRVSYEDLLLEPQGNRSAPPEAHWKDKIVLVGVTRLGNDAGGADDADVYTVLDDFAVQQRHGVELHADVVSTLLAPSQVHSLHWAGQLLFTIASVAVAVLVRLSSIRLSRPLEWCLALGAAAFYILMVGWLCAKFHVLLNCVYHLAAFGVTYWLLGRLPALAKR